MQSHITTIVAISQVSELAMYIKKNPVSMGLHVSATWKSNNLSKNIS